MMLCLNTAARRVTFCIQDQGQKSGGQRWQGPRSLRDLAGCAPCPGAAQIHRLPRSTAGAWREAVPRAGGSAAGKGWENYRKT